MQNHEQPTIIWEKWNDPYGSEDDIEWPDFDEYNNDTDLIDIQKPEKVNVMITNMGIIPYNEYTDCTKIFNFWIGHTNFSITHYVANLLNSITGVETLDIFTRYRFRISFGKAFNQRDIINSINTRIANDTTIRQTE
jgi:hypothetical protein